VSPTTINVDEAGFGVFSSVGVAVSFEDGNAELTIDALTVWITTLSGLIVGDGESKIEGVSDIVGVVEIELEGAPVLSVVRFYINQLWMITYMVDSPNYRTLSGEELLI